MRRALALTLVCALCLGLLAGCADARPRRFSVVWLDLFDTVTVLTAYARDQKEFDGYAQTARGVLVRWHKACDAYADGSEGNGLSAVNQSARRAPVPAAPELIEVLLWFRQNEALARGRVNPALGAMLNLWHAFRLEGGAPPDVKRLTEAAAHGDFGLIDIDGTQNTVYYKDADIRLDVGAFAKGYAVEMAARALDTYPVAAYLISVGGSVRARGAPPDGRGRWTVGVHAPDGAEGDLLAVLRLTDASVATSGDDQRYITANGVRYHHLIDPDTLMPARHVRQVTVIAAHAGLADLLSTTLFLMPYEEARACADALPGVEAYWVLPDGRTLCTDGFAALLEAL